MPTQFAIYLHFCRYVCMIEGIHNNVHKKSCNFTHFDHKDCKKNMFYTSKCINFS